MKLPEYKNIQEKTDYFDNFVIETPKDFETFYSDFANEKGLIYRGVNEAKFHIYTSAQRFWLTDNLKSQSSFACFIDVLLSKLKSDNTSSTKIFTPDDIDLVENYLKKIAGFTMDSRSITYQE